MLIVFEYDIDVIKSAIVKYIESVPAKNWDEIAARVARIAAWEFEDYQP